MASLNLNANIVIGVTGPAGSGLSTLASSLVNQLKMHGIQVFRTDVNGNEVEEENLDPFAVHQRMRSMSDKGVKVTIVQAQMNMTPVFAPAPVELLRKSYSGDELSDVERDLSEAFDNRINPVAKSIPDDAEGSFELTLVWKPE